MSTDSDSPAYKHAEVSVPVVIVGAGPTGVTAATLLAQYGIHCLVLERWDDVYPQPRAVHLDDEVCRILSRLGVYDEFAAISRPAMGLRLLDPHLGVLAQFHRDPTESIHGFPQANMFDQPDFEALLRRNLKNFPAAAIRGHSEVTDISQTESGRVRVTYADRATGKGHIIDAAYVLGCDGANSVVRSSIGAAMQDLRFEQRWLVVDVATDMDLNQWDGVHQVCSPVRAATYMRIGATRYRWEFRLLPGETADDYRSCAALRRLISPWVGHVPDDGLELVRVAEYTFRAQLANRWRDRNVFLLGDAAHLTPPFIGQGMGAGLRDAMNLAWKLAGVLQGNFPEKVLDTYEQERKPHARMLIGLALGMGWAMTAGGRTGDAIRRTVVPRLHLIPGMRTRLLKSRTPALRRSAFVVKGRRPRQLAGTLCPNPLMPEGSRLDALLGTGFAVIMTAQFTAQQREQLHQRGAVALTVDAASELGRWLRHGRATAAMIRPDRTVMEAGRRVSSLCDAVPRFTPAVNAERTGSC
ncbi:bifunctional 3-(3-hydroxy-phenyl)propionate/3-hydroxycinnamic acid hydroxylase MhpA [Mycobacterium noviomagense]|uniref:3-(3-hydroxyphenyl)propionate hydroxylase n=1 Tax=Mycobacterium noviomagense TaxID=459858 RepID=A0A7I7PGB0_9MYCO|nr:bifunctional 3-(3-hydroxy-phenyl)propionate/3-hydroxycinnamic acid hydroxylase [Mycobacterium noviomagense]ORB17024.1 3-(3-hydroxyphenyl)propionate hydroxylase [Mycobacterium noviomagense]BBY07664.1 3-(3-hydroxyphenyl)propionate hydroxylase [Mycobacterium noviomagense]